MTQREKLPPPPPLLLTELDDVVSVLKSKLPAILGAMSSQMGVTVSLPKQAKQKYSSRLSLLASRLRPFALVEKVATGQLPVHEFSAAFHECLVRAYLEANGKRVPPSKHAMVYLVEMTEGLLPSDSRFRQNPEYSRMKKAVHDFSEWVVVNGSSEQVEVFFRELASSTEMTKHWQFLMQLDTLQRRWCNSAPKRFSWGVVHRLSDEFRDWGPFIEMRMKLFVGLHRSLCGKHGWREVEHQTLNNLQQMARAEQPLAPIADAINRNVRNALAHGVPFVDPRTKTCRFVDRSFYITWTLAEFFKQTRNLRLSSLALARFEGRLLAARLNREVRQSFESYWQQVQNPSSSTAESHPS